MKKFARELSWSLRICALTATMMLAGCLDLNSSDSGATTEEAVVPLASDTLTILGEPPTEVSSQTTYFFQPAMDASADTARQDIAFSIQNKPDWLNFDASSGALSGVPGDAQVGVTDEITITARASSALKSGTIGPFRITVKPRATGSAAATVNASPSIGGNPLTTVAAKQAYSFTPTAADPEGAALSFSIVNRPTWATFDTATGRLTGTPQTGNYGRYADITIRVSDGNSSVSLPAFSIDVVPVAAAVAVTIAPTIGGTPVTAAVTGSAYSFTPTANDVNGDTLTFTIQNKPTWAAFNASTGQLYGTPTSAGTSSNILISASDGKATATLNAFTITVANTVAATTTGSAMLSWTAPDTNADWTVLTNLAGFHVYAGKDPSNLTRIADLAGGTNTQYQATGLDAGIWYFTISAYNSAGVESAQPAAVSKTIT
jgi:hypothetical protein